MDQENKSEMGKSFQFKHNNKIKVDHWVAQSEHSSNLGSLILAGSTSSFNIIEYILAKNSLGKFKKS